MTLPRKKNPISNQQNWRQKKRKITDRYAFDGKKSKVEIFFLPVEIFIVLFIRKLFIFFPFTIRFLPWKVQGCCQFCGILYHKFMRLISRLNANTNTWHDIPKYEQNRIGIFHPVKFLHHPQSDYSQGFLLKSSLLSTPYDVYFTIL